MKDRTNITVRNRLGDAYFPYVKRHAAQVANRLPNTITADELVGPGCHGLLQAIDSFDPRRGVTFVTYSTARIRGAMLDYLREQDPFSRAARQADVAYRRWREARQVAGQSARDEDLPIEEWARKERLPSIEGLSKTVYENAEGRTSQLGQLLPGRSDLHPAEQEEFWRHLLRGLSDNQRMIVLLYFRDGWTMRAIGESLGFSESRVSQLMSQTLALLRQREDKITCAGWLPARN